MTPDLHFVEPTALFLILALAGGYLLGSIPFGLILTRAVGLGDIRSIGSGNIGATNVLRTGNKLLAAATLLLDALKGTVAVFVAGQFGLWFALAAGLGAFLGHLYPVWLKFNGGKGIATYVGVLGGLALPGLTVFAVLWLSTAWLTRYSSLAALIACLVTPPALFFLGYPHEAVLFMVMTALSLYKHRANIARLRAGTEGQIGARG